MSELELRPVPGPSAVGGGWRRALELLYLIAEAEFRRTYFGTALGYLWSIARPLMLFGVLYVVFTEAFRLGSDVPHYAVLLLANLVIFGFFQEATNAAVGSVVAHEAIVRKTQFPRIVIPLATVLTALFNLGPNLLVVLAFLLATGVTPMWTWLLIPLVIAVLGVFTTAVAMIVSALYPRYRDVGIIWTVLGTALFYGTPVLYPIGAISENLREIVSLNPLAPLFTLVHRWLIDPSAPLPERVLIPALLFAAVCVAGVWVFTREAPRVAEQL
jgi:ABC-2 type transport system permease protein